MTNNEIKYIGVNDHEIDLFEGQYKVPNGMSYNSYLIKDERIAVIDSVDVRFAEEWIKNIKNELKDVYPHYLIIQHMEPDHSGSIFKFSEAFPNTKIVSNQKAFAMMQNFFETDFAEKRIVVSEGDSLNLGNHLLKFIFAPMVHWPEVMFTYEENNKILFSADAFGKFGALDKNDAWDDEARRYYIGIVGKYGTQVQNVLKKASGLEIKKICPLHGPVLEGNLNHYFKLYDTWSKYEVETEGVLVLYTSVYSHTKEAALKMADIVKEKGAPNVEVFDLARSDMSECVAKCFQYGKIVLATTTYNADIYPFMKELIIHLTERGFKGRTLALIENGSWAPNAIKTIKKMLEASSNIKYLSNELTIKGALTADNIQTLDAMAVELCEDYILKEASKENKQDLSALFNIGYGLYVVTTNLEGKDNGMICNSVTQVTNTPNRIQVTINKTNYTVELIQKSKKLNLNCLSEKAPFEVFTKFGFVSGRDKNKFEGEMVERSDNGVVYLSDYINSFISLNVTQTIDLGTHIMFICEVSEARVFNKIPTMTYQYYQDNVKPKKEVKVKGWVCKICGYVYEGENLPEDFICPLCKHPASDFEKIE